MRTLLVLLILSAGCLGATEADSSDDAEDEVPEETPMAPEPISDSQTATGSADPMNWVGAGICATPESQCWDYDFSANASLRVHATLTWEIDASDFDLYLFSGGEQLAMSADTPPETLEEIISDLEPGDYTLTVVAWAVAQDTFTLEAGFELL